MGKKADASPLKVKKAVQKAVEKAVRGEVDKALAAVTEAIHVEVDKAVQAAVKKALAAEAMKARKLPKPPKPEAPQPPSGPAQPFAKTLTSARFDLAGLHIAALLPQGPPPGDIPLDGPPLVGLPPAAPMPPPTYDLAVANGVGNGIPVFGTKADQNCVFSAIGNIIYCWSANTQNPLRISYSDLVTAWGYVSQTVQPGAQPPNPLPLPNFNIPIGNALSYWAAPGIGAAHDTVGRYAQLSGYIQLFRSITAFGGVLITLYLPQSIIDNTPPVWDAAPDDPRGNVCHAVAAIGYDTDGLDIISWGMPYRMTWKFLGINRDPYHCFAVIGNDWIRQQPLQESPPPLNLTQAQLAQLFSSMFGS
jgi:hypothetical protein